MAERATLNVSRFFLSNKHARTFVFFYTVLLHMLVLFVMYDLAVREACVHDHGVAAAVAANAVGGLAQLADEVVGAAAQDRR